MSEKTDRPAKVAEKKPPTHAEAKAAYDALAQECTTMAAQRPKVRVEVEKRVKQEMGDFEKKFNELKARKHAAALELHAAEERERPELEAKAKAEADAKERAAQNRMAEANARRKAEQEQAEQRRARDAVTA